MQRRCHVKTEMTETIYNSKDTEGPIKARVRRVVFNASKFAEMENTAFWEDCPGNCVAVREGSEAPDTADIIPCRRIGKALTDWANAQTRKRGNPCICTRSELVEIRGVEPLTFSMPLRRSTN